MSFDAPYDLMTDRVSLYGFVYTIVSGSKTKTPVEKKSGIRCMIQDATPELETWYYQRQELIHNSMFLVDLSDFALIEIDDRITFNGQNYRVAGRHNLAGRGLAFRVDLRLEM